MENKNILISGAGIAGTTLAFWLKRFGFNPTIVEREPELPKGGYAIDFWGAGFVVAERMGIVPELKDADLNIQEVTFVDESDKRKGGLSYAKMKKLMNGRAINLLRSDLAKIIYNNLDKDIEFIWGDSISIIEQKEKETTVTFKSGKIRNFDLVAGADGLHSNIRKLTFEDDDCFEKYYGYYTSSFTINESYGHKEFKMYNIPGKQAAVYSTNEKKWTTFFLFTSPEKLTYHYQDIDKQKEILQNEFENIGWNCAELISKMEAAPDFYFDSVSQIRMDNWSKNRITLVGDACACPSLLSGQGSTLAMVAAYILAGELKEAKGDYTIAFKQYQSILKPFIDKKQRTAQNFAKSFVPKSKFGIWVRNFSVRLVFLPFISQLFIKHFMNDDLRLKPY